MVVARYREGSYRKGYLRSDGTVVMTLVRNEDLYLVIAWHIRAALKIQKDRCRTAGLVTQTIPDKHREFEDYFAAYKIFHVITPTRYLFRRRLGILY